MKSIQILLVEDNEGDILLTKEAFEESRLRNKITVVKNGRDAVDYLFKQGKFKEAATPDLVLLDVNLPFKNGHEVLEIVKTNDNTKHIPIIMLTTSSSQSDINRSYKNHANCYITKPIDVDDFLKTVVTIENFWLDLVMLPKE